MFFQREDVWSVAQHITVDNEGKQQTASFDPYIVDAVAGKTQKNEFVLILPFTPANRNNMIGWMAGRSDGENYGKLLGYNFPSSRLIDGPTRSKRESIRTRSSQASSRCGTSRAHA